PPSPSRLRGLGPFGRRALAAVARGAPPLQGRMRNRRMSAEGLRHGGVKQTRLRDALMASGAAVNYSQIRDPDLIDLRTIIREQAFGIGAGLGKAHIRALVVFPFA